jgi:hypothetical protein
MLPVPARLSAVPWSTEVRIKGKPKVILTAFLKPKVFNDAAFIRMRQTTECH